MNRCSSLKAEIEILSLVLILDKEWPKLKKRYLKYLKKTNFDKNIKKI